MEFWANRKKQYPIQKNCIIFPVHYLTWCFIDANEPIIHVCFLDPSIKQPRWYNMHYRNLVPGKRSNRSEWITHLRAITSSRTVEIVRFLSALLLALNRIVYRLTPFECFKVSLKELIRWILDWNIHLICCVVVFKWYTTLLRFWF